MRARITTQRDVTTLWRAAGPWVAFAIAVAASCGLMPRPAMADEFLACGVPTTRHLQMGITDKYIPEASSELPLIADVTDIGGTIGLLQLTPLIFCGICPFCPPCPSSCEGSIAFPASPTPLAVSDCVGSNTGDYTIEFNIVAQSPENCGRHLSCGTAPNDTVLSVLGEVDAYTFDGVSGQQISLTAAATSDTISSLRMRLFSPKGDLQSDSCSGTLTYDVPSTGTYTVLVSACVAPATGSYSIVWQTLPACPALSAPAFAYVTHSGSGTVAVLDLTPNQPVSIVPTIVPASAYTYFSAINTSANDGFAYATFGQSGTISIINTTLNRVVGSVSVPVNPDNAEIRVGVDPLGRYVYAPSNVLGGLVVINTATRKIDAVIPIGGNGYDGNGFEQQTPIALSPDGKLLYVGVVVGGRDTLTVIDTTSRTIVGRVTDMRMAGPVNISLNPTGTLVYVTNATGISVVDTATLNITQSQPLPLTDIAYSRDRRVAYGLGRGSDGQAAILVIDTATLAVTNTLPLSTALGGDNIAAVALSPGGDRLLVTNPSGGDQVETGASSTSDRQPAVVVIDTRTLEVIGTMRAVGDQPFGIAVVTPPSGLCTADDRGQTRVTVGELVTAVDYSVDGCPTARANRPATP